MHKTPATYRLTNALFDLLTDKHLQNEGIAKLLGLKTWKLMYLLQPLEMMHSHCCTSDFVYRGCIHKLDEVNFL